MKLSKEELEQKIAEYGEEWSEDGDSFNGWKSLASMHGYELDLKDLEIESLKSQLAAVAAAKEVMPSGKTKNA